MLAIILLVSFVVSLTVCGFCRAEYESMVFLQAYCTKLNIKSEEFKNEWSKLPWRNKDPRTHCIYYSGDKSKKWFNFPYECYAHRVAFAAQINWTAVAVTYAAFCLNVNSYWLMAVPIALVWPVSTFAFVKWYAYRKADQRSI
jgi:hypothetical protein